jgi:hypothetical protein
MLGAAGEVHAQTVIPSDRNFPWNPGMMSKGGIPSRTTICATLSPSGSDDSAAIQAKLDSCPSGQVVMLNAGTFTVNNYLLVHSSITLRGSGAGTTILKKTNGAKARTSTVVSGTIGLLTPTDPTTYSYDAQPIIVVGPTRWPSPDNSTSQNLAADVQQGLFSVTVASASGYAAGQFVLLDETSGASWQATPAGFPGSPQVWQGDRVAWNMHFPTQAGDDNGNSNASGPFDSTPGVLPAAMSWFSRTNRPTNEIKEIASVSGNTITFTSPLTIGYRTSHQAQLTRYTLTGAQSGANSIHVTNAGVENLSTYGGGDGQVRFENAAYSWAKSVEVTQWLGEGFAANGSFRVEIRDSYVHTGSWPEPGGAGYMISLANASSEVLIENNILIDACKEMVFRSSGAGSVVAYNYADDSWDFDTPGWVEVGLNASHMAGPHHVLFEGNYSQNIDSDYTHGNAIYLTFFRNWLSGKRRDFNDVPPTAGNIRTIGLAYGSWWDSFVGNVLGRPGLMSGWNYTDPSMSCDASGNNCTGNNANWSDNEIWKLGYDPERWGMHPDLKTLSTVIRDGNFDFLTNSQRWHNTAGGFTIPNSMYLTTKPAFFGSGAWPWVDPTTGKTYTLPAKARYDAGTPFGVTISTNTHDFNGDGKSDILWQDTSGNVAVWLMNGAQITQAAGVANTTWTIVGQHDFNGDGKTDVLLRDNSGNVGFWFMNGGQITQAAGIANVSSVWSIAGGGDFNGDGKADILWRDNSGNVAVWLMNGAQIMQAVGVGNTTWTIVGTGDFNGDGKTDILLRDNSGNVGFWLMDGAQIMQAGGIANVSSTWTIAGTGDFDGDGKTDILWRDSSGNVAIWFMNGTQITQAAGVANTTWTIVGTGDYNGDGKSDILMHDNSGNLGFWFMNGAQIAQAAGIANVSSAWTIQSANSE